MAETHSKPGGRMTLIRLKMILDALELSYETTAQRRLVHHVMYELSARERLDLGHAFDDESVTQPFSAALEHDLLKLQAHPERCIPPNNQGLDVHTQQQLRRFRHQHLPKCLAAVPTT